ncbi:hemolysin family protein [Sneathiella litorea]|nr:hemolysin family protein [Sneathiella litorea]
MTDNMSRESLSEQPVEPPSQKPTNAVLHILKRVLGIGQQTESSVRSTLEELIEEHNDPEQSINASEKLMLTNILSFSELSISDVLVPRADIEAIDANSNLHEVVKRFKETSHSRMPVYSETLDNVTGMFHIKDLINFWGDKDAGDWLSFRREILFVPPSMTVPDLLLKMRATHIHMAAVVDEYGGIDGLVTIEDLVEEIVGDIEDEHDEKEGPLIIVGANGMLEADARASIEELESLVDMDLLPEEEDDEVDTVGGLVFQLAGQIPARGEIISHSDGLDFEIIDADLRKVKKVRIRRRPPDADLAE